MNKIKQFRDDFFTMLKHDIGYLPWAKKYPYRLDRLLNGKKDNCCVHKISNGRQMVRQMLSDSVCDNQMIDLFFKALIRSEIRFSSRFGPQRSHEERLTGHLISEIGASIELIKDDFINASLAAYNVTKNIDFFYFDMSKGGKMEKTTGADLAFTVIIDLPDYPKVIKSIIFQAKKYSHTAQLDLNQYELLTKYLGKSVAYLFFDQNIKSLSSPFVLETDDYTIKQKYDEAINGKNKSFSINEDDIFDGLPLSSYICFNLISNENVGIKHVDLEAAINYFKDLNPWNKKIDLVERGFDGYLGIVSIGRQLKYQPNNTNEGYVLFVE